MKSAKLVVAAVALSVSAGCVHDADSPVSEARGPRVAPVTLVERRGAGAVRYVIGNRVYGAARTRPIQLAAHVNANLIASLAPAAVPGPSGAALAYNSWRGRRPVLRVRRQATRADVVLDDGAHSAAWASDGALAYFKAARPDLTDPRRYLGHVVVREARNRPATAWTPRAGRYVVAAWAGRSLLAYRLRTSFPDLLALDGPGRERLLARGTALVAVSPDGRRAFVSRYGVSPAVVRVLDIDTGDEIARLRVGRSAAAYVIESGSWVDDRVFAPTTTGIAVFRVASDRIALDRVLRTEHELPTGIAETRADETGRRVSGWGELPSQAREAIPRAALVECEVDTFRCVRVAVTSSAAPPRPVYNPSRP